MDYLLPHLLPWLLVLFRLSGVFLLTPVLGSQTIPRQVKVFLVLALSFCLYPVLISPQQASSAYLLPFVGGELSMWTLIPLCALELLIGYTIGYAATIPLVGLQVGGHVIDQQMGLGLAGVFNPELNEQSSPTGEVLFLLGMALFLIIGGHHAVFAVLVSSFQHIPPAGFTDFAAIAQMALGMVRLMLELAFKIAAPVMCLLFLESVATGFIARTAPQMNILSIGFAVRIILGLLLMVAAVSTVGSLAIDAISAALEAAATLVRL